MHNFETNYAPQSTSIIKMGVVYIMRHLKEKLACAIHK